MDLIDSKTIQIEGLFRIVERRNNKGLRHWADELERRHIPAVIGVDEYTIDNDYSLLRELADRGFEIGGTHSEGPFWNEPYSIQYDKMNRIRDKLESIVGRPMRVMGSQYFAYNEDTLRVAEKLGAEYIFARGTAGARAVVYKPEEYNIKILSVSSVPSNDMSMGSLCDASLWARGATPDDLRTILFSLREDRIVLVAQTHISGVKLYWWNAYRDFLDANVVSWKSLDEFSLNPIVLPNAQIRINKEIDYTTPRPKVPLEKELEYLYE
jgi:hypothetical protein